MKRLLRGWEPGRLAQNALWAMVGQAARLGVQAIYFVLVARALGPGNYGAFCGVTALIAIFSSFVGLGTGPLLLRQIPRDPQRLPFYWGRTLGISLGSGIILLLISQVVADWYLPASVPRLISWLVALSDLLLLPVHMAGTQLFQACERLRASTFLHIGLSASRLLMALGMIALVRSPGAEELAWCYLAATLLAVIIGCTFITREFGRPRWHHASLLADVRQASFFQLSWTAQFIVTNADKTLLLHFSALATGIYTAANRINEMSLIPVFALMAAAIPRLFQQGQGGLSQTHHIGRRVLRVQLAYCIPVVFGLVLCSPLLPWLLGSRYDGTVLISQWMAPLLMLRMLHAVAADILSGAGYQRQRSLLEITAAALNIGLNYWWIQRSGALGAVWAQLATFAFSAALLWMALLSNTARERRQSAEVESHA